VRNLEERAVAWSCGTPNQLGGGGGVETGKKNRRRNKAGHPVQRRPIEEENRPCKYLLEEKILNEGKVPLAAGVTS